jgi:hypothetical protein
MPIRRQNDAAGRGTAERTLMGGQCGAVAQGMLPVPRPAALLCLLACVAVPVGCAFVRPPARPATHGAPIALVLQGSAFEQQTTREGTRARLEARLDRPVVILDGPTDAAVDAKTSRLLSEIPGTKRYDRRERRCAKEQEVAAALAMGADVVYRVSLDYTAASRSATKAEMERGGDGTGRMLAAVGLAKADAVLEETLSGEVERASFEGTPSERRRIARTEWHVAPTALTKRLDLPDETVAALAQLPPTAPRWDAVARRLIANGCPLLALAVEDAFVRDDPAKRKVHAAAVAAIRERTTPPKKAKQAKVEATPPTVEPSADVATEPTAKSPQLSCRKLCELHMVELCNNDRGLWIQNRTNWEGTRCGTRRAEPFLESCYRMHWLDGTYEHACMQPCEGSDEGRDRLLLLLQRAGCLRAGA